MNEKKCSEFDIIDRLTSTLGPRGPRVVRGVGDDTAVLQTNDAGFLLATCDVQIEGIHFTLESFTPHQVGRRVAAVNLSDIAAMGGTPTFAIVSLAVPKQTEPGLLDGIYAGLNEALREWGAEIVGGNTARLPERIAIDVTLLGDVNKDGVLTRTGAQPGDLLCVTGSLGASAAGLEILMNDDSYGELDRTIAHKAIDAHVSPIPRVAEGQFLGASGLVTACIDISDGLYGDAMHIAVESGVMLTMDAELVPVADGAIEVADLAAVDAVQLALGGGEDYELLFTVSKSEADDLIAGLTRATGTSATVIGRVCKGSPDVEILRSGQPMAVTYAGFDHFK